MDKRYQDIKYINNSPYRKINSDNVVWVRRQIHLIDIHFRDKYIFVRYEDIDYGYHYEMLENLPYHYLIID